MAQVHQSQKEFNPFEPYQNMTWLTPSQLAENWSQVQQTFWQGYWEWLAWQQRTMQHSLYETSRWVSHCFELSSQPKTLYRYMRFNWQKPYIELGSQVMTSNRMLTRLMVENWEAWQNAFHIDKKH